MTQQRRAVIDVIERSRTAFTAADVLEAASAAVPNLGLATVYRTLELLRREGSVRRLAGEDAVYVRCHTGHHHHLVCLTCGDVEDTELCAAPSAAELERTHGFAAAAHELDIYGTCARCA